jgi:hypothetical protein
MVDGRERAPQFSQILAAWADRMPAAAGALDRRFNYSPIGGFGAPVAGHLRFG